MSEQIQPGLSNCRNATDVASLLTVDRALEIVATFTITASLIGLAAALAGVFHAPQVLLGSLIATAIYWSRTRGRGLFSGIVKPSWWHVCLLIIVALFFRLPAYNYVLGGQDEGLYTNIAQHIDHTGGIAVYDSVAERLTDSPYIHQYFKDNRLFGISGVYVPGVYARNPKHTNLEFQFYHLFPTWMALFSGLFGATHGIYALTYFAILSVIFFYRLALLLTHSHRAALIAGGLLALSPLHAFFSKFPVTEVPTLAFSLMGFTLLATYWSADPDARRSRWLWLSILAFLCLFTTRISGFMYVPFFIAMAMVTLIFDKDRARAKAIQNWALGTIFVYLASVVYGFVWSSSYSRDIYALSFGRFFGARWKVVIVSVAVAVFVLWLACRLLHKKSDWNNHIANFLVRPINRWLGLFVAGAVCINLLKIYWLGWTDHYAVSNLNKFWHLSGQGFQSIGTSSLWTLFVFLGPPMVFGFFALVGRRHSDPRLDFLRFFTIGFFVYGVALQWDTPYSPYYARYLLSELAPYLILLVVCIWAAIRQSRVGAWVSLVLAFSVVYSAAISAMQIGKSEDAGAHTELARLVSSVGPDDMILLDTLQHPPYTSLIKTPLVYTFHRDVVTVGDETLSKYGYLAMLDSLSNKLFLISFDSSAPAGFTGVGSVRFRPMTYEHNHLFPYKLVPKVDVVLYLYRLDHLRVAFDQPLSFANGQPWGSWLRSGWSTPEDWGVWSDATRSVLTIDRRQLPIDASKLHLHVKAVVYVTPQHPRQHIGVSLNGRHVADYQVSYPTTKLSMTIPVPSSAWIDKRRLSVAFTLPDAASPRSLGRSGDGRQLALGLVSMTVTGDESLLPALGRKEPTELPAVRH